MKKVHHVKTRQHGGLEPSLSQSRNSTISQSLCAGAPCCWKLQSTAEVKLFQQLRENDHFEQFLCGKTSAICHQWGRLSSPSKQGSYSATDSTSWVKQVCTHDTLWHKYYITTSKEYLGNSHNLLKYFELVFLQLRLVKISCKLITIWVNYKRKKRSLFMKHRVIQAYSHWTNAVIFINLLKNATMHNNLQS